MCCLSFLLEASHLSIDFFALPRQFSFVIPASVCSLSYVSYTDGGCWTMTACSTVRIYINHNV
jgi:hypothetical protein